MYLAVLLAPFCTDAQTSASSSTDLSSSPVAVTVPFRGPSVAYGDIVDYDAQRGAYVLSQYADDPHIYGVVVKDPPLLFSLGEGVPVTRTGEALINVTTENGPIAAGDQIITSSIPGKGMRASASSTNPIGVAREGFDGKASSTPLSLHSGTVQAGTIAVDLGAGVGTHALTQTQVITVPASGDICIIQCVPFGVLIRYLTAALVSFGSVYLAFRAFMADAVTGVASIGRNPKARASIQSMVVFNAVLAVALAFAGLVAGIVILFIKL